MLGNEQFKKENLPIRTVRIAVIADTTYDEWFVREMFFQASTSLENQVGIRLEIVHFAHGKLPHRSVNKTFMMLAHKCIRLPVHDITIGITYIPPAEDDMNMEMPSKIGVANHLLGNIHLRGLYPTLIVHEVGHLLLGHTGHSLAGVMFTPAQNIYFTITDRRIILSRKRAILRPCTTFDELERTYGGP